MTKKEITFEEAMERMEEILRTLESGNETLDATLALYEEGVGLVRTCSRLLECATQRVQMLRITSEGEVALSDFEGKEETV